MTSNSAHHLQLSMRRKNPFHIISLNTIIPTSIYYRSIQHVLNPSTLRQPFCWAKFHPKCCTGYQKTPARQCDYDG